MDRHFGSEALTTWGEGANTAGAADLETVGSGSGRGLEGGPWCGDRRAARGGAAGADVAAAEHGRGGTRKPPLPSAARPLSRGGVRISTARCASGGAKGRADSASRVPGVPSTRGAREGGLSYWPPLKEMDRSWREASRIPWMAPQREGAHATVARRRLHCREHCRQKHLAEALNHAAAYVSEGSDDASPSTAYAAAETPVPMVTSRRCHDGSHSSQPQLGALPPVVSTNPPRGGPPVLSVASQAQGSQSHPTLPSRPLTAPNWVGGVTAGAGVSSSHDADSGCLHSTSMASLAVASATSVVSAASSAIRPHTVGGWGKGCLQLPEPRRYIPSLAAEAALSSTGLLALTTTTLPLFAPRYHPGVRAMLKADARTVHELSLGEWHGHGSAPALARVSSSRPRAPLRDGAATTERLEHRFSPMRPGWAPGP